MWLAWPVLIQQFLILAVGLSDRFLAGYFQPVPPRLEREAVGHELLAVGLFGGTSQPLSGLASLEAAAQIQAKHIAFQSAQTTAHYLNWFISSYTVLVSVGSTALVARFVGAGDSRLAVRVTNQSIILAAGLGLAATLAGLVGLGELVGLLQLQGDAAQFARSIWSLWSSC
jgi:Na+-driven multidrug efflux pump